jgi:hypothetical protein
MLLLALAAGAFAFCNEPGADFWYISPTMHILRIEDDTSVAMDAARGQRDADREVTRGMHSRMQPGQ